MLNAESYRPRHRAELPARKRCARDPGGPDSREDELRYAVFFSCAEYDTYSNMQVLNLQLDVSLILEGLLLPPVVGGVQLRGSSSIQANFGKEPV